MPALPRLKTRVLRELCEQVRFAPPQAARRQLVRAEILATEILLSLRAGEARAVYDAAWIRKRLTGLDEADAPDAGEQIPRDALVADLGPLVERFSAAADLALGGSVDAVLDGGPLEGELLSPLDGPTVALADLAKRWSVSIKTLERARRDGLLSRRVGRGVGQRVVVSEAAAALYASIHADRLEQAAYFSRLTEREQASIQRRGTRYARALAWNLTRTSRRLAAVLGRSHESVRRVLARARTTDAKGHSTLVFPRTTTGRSRTARHRSSTQSRAAALAELDLAGPTSPMLDHPDAASVVLSAASVRTGLGAPGPATIGALLSLPSSPAPEVEQARAVACAFLLHRARTLQAKLLAGDHRVESVLEPLELDVLYAARLRAELVRSQLGLVVRTAEQSLGPGLEHVVGAAAAGEVMSVLLEAACAGVERFDPFKGGRLAAPVGVAVGKALTQWLRRASSAGLVRGPDPRRARGKGDVLGVPIPDITRAAAAFQAAVDLPAPRSSLDLLAPADRALIERRFALAGSPPESLSDIARSLNTTRSALSRRVSTILRTLRGARP